MNTQTSSYSAQSYRDKYKRRYSPFHSQSTDEQRTSIVNERLYPIKLRRRRSQSTRSFYDNHEDAEIESVVSKWTIVRQRLPDILALSSTYKPTTVRAQLVLLLALMNRQQSSILPLVEQINCNEYNSVISHVVPSNVVIDIAGRNRSICLKRVPPEQVIHVDIDGLSFSLPARQFILSISRGYAHKTTVNYCPPAIADMLIDISKRKMIDDRRQYKRAQFKMRLGQFIFLIVFSIIISMVIALIIGATKTMSLFNSKNATLPYISLESIPSNEKFPRYFSRSFPGR